MSLNDQIAALLPTNISKICALLAPFLAAAPFLGPESIWLAVPSNQEVHVWLLRVAVALSILLGLSLVTIISLVHSTYRSTIDLRAAMQDGAKRVLASRCPKNDCPLKQSGSVGYFGSE